MAKKKAKWNGSLIIGFAGRKKAGKDTAADYLLDEYDDAIKINFSDPILEELNKMLAVHNLTVDPNEKDVFRGLLEKWGDFRRQQDEDYWTKKIAKRIDEAIQNKTKLILVCGPRDIAELEIIKSRTGELWKIIRPTKAVASDWPTEDNLDMYTSYDRYILNDGKVEALHEKVDEAFEKLLISQSSK